jgi:acetylornithine/N-succinyldiaminopimelate aminotransferase
MHTDNLIERAKHLGDYLMTQLREKLAHLPMVKEVRGKGLMIGIELDRNAFALMELIPQHKVLFNITSNTVVRLLPAMIMSDQEADELVQRIKMCLEAFSA